MPFFQRLSRIVGRLIRAGGVVTGKDRVLISGPAELAERADS